MCGIVGTAGRLAHKDEATIKRLLLLDYFRGPDSTGFSAVRDNGEFHTVKIASHPLDLFDMQRFKSALSGYNSKCFIGHNRAATRGAVTSYNAHPFEFDHIVGCHNGTLESSSVKEIEDALGEKFGVDSMALFAAIAKLGINKTMKLLTTGKDSQTGAWSLVWYDRKEDSLNFLRNKHRPMWLAYSEDCKQIFWASEWEMINAATRMSSTGYDMYVEKETDHKFWPTDEDVHYKFDLTAMQQNYKDEPPKPVVKKLPGKEPVSVVVSSPFHRSTPSHSTHNTSTTTSPGTSPKQRTNCLTYSGKEKGEKAIVHLLGDIGKPLAGFMTEARFNDISRYGCGWCGTDVEFEEPGVTIYDRQDLVLCSTCSGNHGSSNLEELPPSRILVRGSTIESLL